ncbi:MAG: hypothetical protein KGJ38_19730 [Burkholderiaceae bacterium]|nr:hypothetical protein [Burkholderiaceae bacterium]
MKKLHMPLLGILTLTVSLTAFAGPDFQAIERARKAQQTVKTQQQDHATVSKTATGDTLKCPPEKLVLPLDHGPRAISTPYLNHKRQERYDAQVKACKEAAA